MTHIQRVCLTACSLTVSFKGLLKIFLPPYSFLRQGLPPGVPDPRFVRTGERGQSSGADPAGRSDSDIHLDLQLECELTDFIGRSSDQRLALDKDIEPHVAQIGLMPPNLGMRQWLLQRPAVFELDGQSVSLTRQSMEYDRHLETQFVAFLQRLGRPAHLGKDVGSYCKKHNIEMRVSPLNAGSMLVLVWVRNIPLLWSSCSCQTLYNTSMTCCACTLCPS